jgi:uncharacterized protein (DUF362 family)
MINKLVVNTLYKDHTERNINNLGLKYDNVKELKNCLRKVLSDSGLNLAQFAGKKLLIKPNWVRHSLRPMDDICLVTHNNFILAVLEILLETKPQSIIIGDAPIQGCNWERMIPGSFSNQINTFSRKYCTPISLNDFRRTVFCSISGNFKNNLRDISNFIFFDLGNKSFLEPITTKKSIFRVTDYNPDRLAESHLKGKHLYCIAKEVFDADYIIALPKAKTHQKTGITNALKLMVGINGDKDYLPHHRVGGTGLGGDCYPGKSSFMRLSEFVLDQANMRINNFMYHPLKFLSKVLWKMSITTAEHSLAAAWYGNDTTWRMVMDLNVIVKFGKIDSTIDEKPQRSIIYICDGIIGGQGDGPLNPDPLPLGIIMLSENPALMDKALAEMMGFNPKSIPLIVAGEQFLLKEDSEIIINGMKESWDALSNLKILTIPPPGWVKHLSPIM